jgi:hypothetical protein
MPSIVSLAKPYDQGFLVESGFSGGITILEAFHAFLIAAVVSVA